MKRAYTMRSRADAVAGTRLRVLRAVRELAEESFDLDPTLEAVAARAGVSVQTVLRHFGTRDALLDAAIAAGLEDTRDERRVPAGAVTAAARTAVAVRTVVAHYEKRGDFMLHLIGHERDDPRFAAITGPGRALHRAWVAEVFAPGSEDVLDLLVVACDLFTWKLLRRDRGLSRAATEARMRRLVDAILGSPA
ncbi:TetR family transcriptional regulator [Cryptosporangium phraense]|uniref:Helix-turn-helix transcriptional regulator n=1 Tax=Cryptosporangium phraense TaxID=2593070 RepID=A0A545AVQ7_9ACTN|nr:TetR family transcriptional regulator [Cryptosporangium phraense]TQS44685.1 helix-turn-helix transcriptional regulator [Cryptosporangium phraense]